MPTHAPTTYTASKARASFSSLLEDVAHGEVFVARHGRPVAVVMAAHRYQELLDTLETLEDEVLAARAEVTLQRVMTGEESTVGFAEVFGEPQ